MDELTLELVLRELEQAEKNFVPMRSWHEGYAVLLEEMEEMWDEIKANNNWDATKEAVQVAAMALRLLNDCGDKDCFSYLEEKDDTTR